VRRGYHLGTTHDRHTGLTGQEAELGVASGRALSVNEATPNGGAQDTSTRENRIGGKAKSFCPLSDTLVVHLNSGMVKDD